MTKALLATLAAALASSSAMATVNLQYSFTIQGPEISTAPPFTYPTIGLATQAYTLTFNGLADDFTSASIGDVVYGQFSLTRVNGTIKLSYQQLINYSVTMAIAAAETSLYTFGSGQAFSYASSIQSTKFGYPAYPAYRELGVPVQTTVSATPFASAAITSVQQVLALPEPAAWAMMLAGFGMVGGMLRRRPDQPILA